MIELCLKLLLMTLLPIVYFSFNTFTSSHQENPSFYQVKAMASQERSCLHPKLCFNGNGHINKAQTFRQSVYQLGFGRWMCHGRCYFEFIDVDDERYTD